MAYCPEDGHKLGVSHNGYDICYDCPECDTHWLYMDGVYTVESHGETCVNCGRALPAVRPRGAPKPMTLTQTLLVLEGIKDQQFNPSHLYHGSLVFMGLGDMVVFLQALGIAAQRGDGDSSGDLWINFSRE